jgi:hypothetical protein
VLKVLKVLEVLEVLGGLLVAVNVFQVARASRLPRQWVIA